jgi:hypothetical protein
VVGIAEVVVAVVVAGGGGMIGINPKALVRNPAI